MIPTAIYSGLTFGDNGVIRSALASYDEYMEGDRCVGSIYEALKPREMISLREGVFELDQDLDPILPISGEHPRQDVLDSYQ